jgi:Tfp pilus assembly protein PilV
MMVQTVLVEHPTTRRVSAGRRGSLLAEVAMATVMVMIAMTLTVKVLGYASLQHRAAEHRQRAELEAANVMERITADPYEAITVERARQAALSAASRATLPGAELVVDVAEDSPGAGRSAKRIAVRLRWRGRSGEWEAPVRLTTWVERRRTAS